LKRVLFHCIGLVLALSPLAAHAQFFVEATFGKGLGDYSTFENQGFSSDRADSTWSAGIGYMFNRFVGIEAGYRGLGESGVSSPNAQSGAIGRVKFNSPGPFALKIESSGVYVGPVLETYIDRVRLNARVGGYFWKSDVTASGAGTFDNRTIPAGGVVTSSQEGVSAYVGAGAQYLLAGGLSLGGSFTRYRVLDDIRVDCWDLRLKYSF
jgi:hypothetical protein